MAFHNSNRIPHSGGRPPLPTSIPTPDDPSAPLEGTAPIKYTLDDEHALITTPYGLPATSE